MSSSTPPSFRETAERVHLQQGEAHMTRATLFTDHGTQIVRLPNAVSFPNDVHQVDVLKIDGSRVIVPLGERRNDLFQNGPRATGDFMIERTQPPTEQRG
jgi:antitoxin VapB